MDAPRAGRRVGTSVDAAASPHDGLSQGPAFTARSRSAARTKAGGAGRCSSDGARDGGLRFGPVPQAEAGPAPALPGSHAPPPVVGGVSPQPARRRGETRAPAKGRPAPKNPTPDNVDKVAVLRFRVRRTAPPPAGGG